MHPEVYTSTFNDANCKKLGIDALRVMYPQDRDSAMEAIGKSICDGCVAFEPCDKIGMTLEINNQGIYGGKTHRERINLKHKIAREHRRGRARTT